MPLLRRAIALAAASTAASTAALAPAALGQEQQVCPGEQVDGVCFVDQVRVKVGTPNPPCDFGFSTLVWIPRDKLAALGTYGGLHLRLTDRDECPTTDGRWCAPGISAGRNRRTESNYDQPHINTGESPPRSGLWEQHGSTQSGSI